MKEYLLQHNVTMLDFWVFVAGFILSAYLLFYFWKRLIKEWKDTDKEINIILLIVNTLMTGFIGTLLLMGAVHFVQMVLFLIC